MEWLIGWWKRRGLGQLHWVQVVTFVAIAIFAVVVMNRRYVLFSDVTFTFRPGHSSPAIIVGDNTLFQSMTDGVGGRPWFLGAKNTPIQVRLPRVVPEGDIRLHLRSITADQLWLRMVPVGRLLNMTTLVHSRFLNTLSWPKETKDGLTMWTRPKVGSIPAAPQASLDSILTKGESVTTAGVNIDRWAFSRILSYTPSSSIRRLPVHLVGPQLIYAYAGKNEQIELTATITTPVEVTARTLTVRVRPAAATAFHQALLEKNIRLTVGQPVERALAFSFTTPEAGMYRLEIDVDPRVLISDFSTNVQYLGLAETTALRVPAGSVSATTHGKSFSFTLPKSLTTQTMMVQGQSLRLTKKKPAADVRSEARTSTLTFSNGEHQLAFDGLLSFAPFRLPPTGMDILDLQGKTEEDISGYDYILARYVPPENDRGNLEVQQSFDLKNLYAKDGRLHFSLYADSIALPDSSAILDSVTVRFSYAGFPWQTIFRKLHLTR